MLPVSFLCRQMRLQNICLTFNAHSERKHLIGAVASAYLNGSEETFCVFYGAKVTQIECMEDSVPVTEG